jgi:membrane carboxypeptidase/penicillin-binding protein PbpC
MKHFAHVIAWLSEILLRDEWSNLALKLKEQYFAFLIELDNRPSQPLQSLLISGEDHRFFSHGGIDVIAVCRSLWRTFIVGKREGASTIEMQIVRVLTGRFENTIRRKIKEMALATLVVRVVPKSVLPSIYLQIGYYVWQMDSLRAACQRLCIDPSAIATEDVASLVARIKYPQPRHITDVWTRKIERRSRHLLTLYKSHQCGRTYAGLSARVRYATI